MRGPKLRSPRTHCGALQGPHKNLLLFFRGRRPLIFFINHRQRQPSPARFTGKLLVQRIVRARGCLHGMNYYHFVTRVFSWGHIHTLTHSYVYNGKSIHFFVFFLQIDHSRKIIKIYIKLKTRCFKNSLAQDKFQVCGVEIYNSCHGPRGRSQNKSQRTSIRYVIDMVNTSQAIPPK